MSSPGHPTAEPLTAGLGLSSVRCGSGSPGTASAAPAIRVAGAVNALPETDLAEEADALRGRIATLLGDSGLPVRMPDPEWERCRELIDVLRDLDSPRARRLVRRLEGKIGN